MTGNIIVNNKNIIIDFNPSETLLITLRKYNFKEVKNGCSEGECGACLILLEEELVNSCQIFTASALGKKITTVKHIGDIFNPSLIQLAFSEAGAVQCGFCTPGMIMATFYLLKNNPNPTNDEIKKALDGNLCRCTGYKKILDAVKLAIKKVK